MKYLIAVLMLSSQSALALDVGGIFVDPQIGGGYNVAQGTFLMVGLDVGYALTEQLAVGVGGFYSAGRRPTDDRAFGFGPFVSYHQPILPWLSAQVREDIDYLDQRDPVQLDDGSYTHFGETGEASITSVSVHVGFNHGLGVTGGYRAVLSLANSDLGHDRSGFFFGLTIGI